MTGLFNGVQLLPKAVISSAVEDARLTAEEPEPEPGNSGQGEGIVLEPTLVTSHLRLQRAVPLRTLAGTWPCKPLLRDRR